jgi:hypothetical protein
LDGGLIASAFEETGCVGVIGTTQGTIWFVDWEPPAETEFAVFRKLSDFSFKCYVSFDISQ